MGVDLSEFGLQILSTTDEVRRFVGDIQAAADCNKEALGFLPQSVYEEAAEQQKLLVAVADENQNWNYAGHLLHGGIFPHARVFQLFTVPRFRRKGVGRRLLESLLLRAESSQFMSVIAQVADDLEANQFWERLSFETVRVRLGGRTTRRKINVRVRELSTPRLFSLAASPSRPSTQDLQLISRLFDVAPTYVLDLNVFFDLLKRRLNSEHVGRIIRASFNNLVRLAVAEEFIRELERTSLPSPTDPILELALRLPQLATPPPNVLADLICELGPTVFPVSRSATQIRVQDASDLIHLATAIHHKARGFITGEKRILHARTLLQSNYDLDVVGATEFASTLESSQDTTALDMQALAAGQLLQVSLATNADSPSIRNFLIRMKCPEKLVQDALATDSGVRYRKVIVTCGGAIIAFGFWETPSPLRGYAQAFVCVDEDHGSVTNSADFVLDLISREPMAEYPAQVSLRLLPGHVTTRRIAIAHGFRPSANEPANSTNLHKICMNMIVTAKSWPTVRQHLKTRTGLEFPALIPRFESLDQPIPVLAPTGQTFSIPLEEIESLLSPAILLLPDRRCAIVPIRAVHAAHLIGGVQQLSMLPSLEAALLHERVYFSSPKTAGVLERGTPIMFYESLHRGGSGSVIAAARALRTEIVSKDGANQELLRRGVLDKKGLKNICLSQTVLATRISNIMLFKQRVPLGKLRFFGAIDGSNLVTARALSGQLAAQIAEEGMS